MRNLDSLWTGSFGRYAVKYASEQAWKVAGLMDPEELVQEFACQFIRVAKRYPDVGDRHLMALFKTAICRHRISLSRKLRDVEFVEVTEDIDIANVIVDVEKALERAPGSIKDFITNALGANNGVSFHKRRGSRSRETNQEMMERVAGHSLPADAYNQLVSWVQDSAAFCV